jgi:hypothetical protein
MMVGSRGGGAREIRRQSACSLIALEEFVDPRTRIVRIRAIFPGRQKAKSFLAKNKFLAMKMQKTRDGGYSSIFLSAIFY